MKLKLNFIFLFVAILCLNIFSANTAKAQYCSPESYYDNANYGYISYINVAGQTSYDDGYGKFYNDYRGNNNFEVKQDGYNDVYVYLGEYYGYSETVAAWIDWNQDNYFDENSELVKFDNWYDGTFYTNMYVPSDAAVGNTTMRIRFYQDWDGLGMYPCGDYYSNYGYDIYGEVEEHYINVLAPYSPAKITADPISNTNLCSTTRNNYLYVSTEGTVVGYQWQKLVSGNWTNISNANNYDYTVSIPSELSVTSSSPLTYSSQFRVLVYSYDGNTETSAPATITAYSPATVSITNPLPYSPCEGGNTTINANVGGSYSGIKWQKLIGSTWTDLSLVTYPTANTPNLSISNLTTLANGTYRCAVTNVSSCNAGTTVTAQIDMNVVSNFTITEQPQSTIRACVGNPQTSIKILTTGTVLSYQWKKDGNSLAINPTSTTNELIVTMPNLKDIGTYTCDIRYLDCNGQSTVITNPTYLNVIQEFSIANQPQEVIVCENQDVALTTVAVGTIYGYQWQKDGKNIELTENPYANSASLFIDKVKHFQSGKYTCLIEAEDCLNGRSVIATNSVLVYAKRGTEILGATTDINAPIGGIATLSIDAHVTAIPPQMVARIQWYRGTTPLVNNNKIAGAKSSILSIRNLDKSDFGSDYWVVVEGLCSSDTARGFVITEVQDADITIDQINDVTVCEATSAVLEANVTANAPIGMNYQWMVDGTMINEGVKYSGVNTNKLTINVVDDTDINKEYTLQVTETTKPTNFKVSNVVKLILKELTTINNTSDKDVNVENGKDLLLFVDATVNQNNQLSYAWFKKDINGVAQQIAGEIKDTLSITGVTTNDAGEYSVTVTSECDGFEFPFNVAVTAAGTTSVERGNLDLNITPNPTSEILNLNLSNIDYTSITITNMVGEVIFTTTNQTKVLNINVNELSLSNGIYLINVIGNKNYTGKFVVNK